MNLDALDPVVTEGLVDRRRRLIRTEIGRIAIDLFAERGFEQVTVDDIAAAAGTSQRTFFRYFATKDEVVLDYERRVLERHLEVLQARPADEGPVTAVRNTYLITSHVGDGDRAHVVRLGRILQAAPTLRATAHSARARHQDAVLVEVATRMGVTEDDPRPRAVVAAMTAVAEAEWAAWVDDGGHGDPAQRIADALAVVEQGLAALDRKVRARRKSPA